MQGHQRIFHNATSGDTRVKLGEGAVIDENVSLGYPLSSGNDSSLVLNIGPNARIRRASVIYLGTSIGKGLETGHNVVIRERNIIGDNFRIWTNSIVDYGCNIGSNVRLHNNIYVAQFTTIEDDVFLGPGVVLTNDIHPGCPESKKCMMGPIIKKGAQIGANACILPRVIIGECSVIGAGSVVTHDIPAWSVAYGNPAQVMGRIDEVVCKTGQRLKPYSHITCGVEDENTIR